MAVLAIARVGLEIENPGIVDRREYWTHIEPPEPDSIRLPAPSSSHPLARVGSHEPTTMPEDSVQDLAPDSSSLADRYAPAQVFSLSNAAGLRIAVMDYGATWLSCTLPLPDGGRRELLLGCADLAEYQRQTYYLGATIGRFTNRIRDARFELDGREVQLLPNVGTHQLHGGPDSFDRRVWQPKLHEERRLLLSLVSPDGDQGYPGELQAHVSYELGDDLSMTICFEARCSAPCPVGLTHHAYFNLDGDRGGDTGSALRQRLRVAADQWLPVDGQMQPAAELAPVEGTGFDLREGRSLFETIAADPLLRCAGGWTTAWP
nr:galactose-1-epimerase [Paucibacter sp. M5-1]MCZ7883054.1 galactose-1-epimerase [Paucibacter sp. M5-1]